MKHKHEQGMKTMMTATFTRTIDNCTTNEKRHNGEERLGRPSIVHISNGIYELIARCRHTEGHQCFRTYGLFRLDDIPQWYYDAR